ncbi:hypothetical protein B0O80DRAFT_427091 [Mortierella sp. GBAus27b]|nr:hypothetical protein B0O80DRAFT_427091 [Mortierella sp. GBAus27b]
MAEGSTPDPDLYTMGPACQAPEPMNSQPKVSKLQFMPCLAGYPTHQKVAPTPHETIQLRRTCYKGLDSGTTTDASTNQESRCPYIYFMARLREVILEAVHFSNCFTGRTSGTFEHCRHNMMVLPLPSPLPISQAVPVQGRHPVPGSYFQPSPIQVMLKRLSEVGHYDERVYLGREFCCATIDKTLQSASKGSLPPEICHLDPVKARQDSEG